MSYYEIEDSRKVMADNPNNCAVSVAIYSSREATLPKFGKVGEIIRFHRANIGSYTSNGKQHKTFYVNVDYGSSWAVFQGAIKEPTFKNSTDQTAIASSEPTAL